jgi:hypothetical protein
MLEEAAVATTPDGRFSVVIYLFVLGGVRRPTPE